MSTFNSSIGRHINLSTINASDVGYEDISPLSDAVDWDAVAAYSTIINIGAIPSMLMYLYVLYVLLRKSPGFMQQSKWMLLNIVCYIGITHYKEY